MYNTTELDVLLFYEKRASRACFVNPIQAGMYFGKGVSKKILHRMICIM